MNRTSIQGKINNIGFNKLNTKLGQKPHKQKSSGPEDSKCGLNTVDFLHNFAMPDWLPTDPSHACY